MAAAWGSWGGGRWWSVTTTSTPSSFARAMGPAADTPLSTVMISVTPLPAIMRTASSDRP